MKHPKAERVAAGPEPAPPVSLAGLNYAEALRLHWIGQIDRAEPLYRAALALEPGHADAHYNLGLIYHSQNKLAEAVVEFREAVFARADFAEAYSNLATVIKAQGMPENALVLYRQALMLAPQNGMTHSNVGLLLNEMGRSAEAVKAFRTAIALAPDYQWAYLNFAPALLELGQHEDSLAACRRGIAANPMAALAHHNLGATFKTMNRIPESIACFRHALTLDANFAEAHFALGQLLLMHGEFEEGWKEYDWRWKLQEYGWLRNIHGEFSKPRWAGEDLTGKTILIYAEQGLGDALQYVRYIPRVLAKGGRVILAVHPPLIPLFAGIPGVEVVALDQVPWPEFDFHCPLLTLPMLFKTDAQSIPAEIPYLFADPDRVKRWKGRIGGKGLKVGLVWAGNPIQRGDKMRSPGLKSVRPLFDVEGVQFVALQVGPGRKDLEGAPLPPAVLDLGPEIKDFADTAAIMKELDLMISSCTAPLHLAGALGVPTWGLIPFAPHLLWQLDRSDSPWYPSLRLYRQDAPGMDWSGVVGRMAADLADLVKRKANGL